MNNPSPTNSPAPDTQNIVLGYLYQASPELGERVARRIQTL